jgi:hypothetical protein
LAVCCVGAWSKIKPSGLTGPRRRALVDHF